MSGSNILDIIAHPAAADQDFYRKGLDNLNALRDTQAKKAIADITQQSIKPDGTMDVPKFNLLISQDRRAAWAGLPAMAAQGRAQAEQAQAGSAQADQAGKVYNFVAAPSASLMNDPSDANLANIRQQLVTAGAPPGAIAELDRMKTLSEADRRTIAYQHNLSAAEAQHRLAAGGFPTPTATTVGDKIVPTSIQPQTPYGPGNMTVQQGGVGIGLTPEQLAAPHDYTDANGQPQHTTVGEYLRTLGVPIQQGGQPIGQPPAAPGRQPATAPVQSTQPGKSIPGASQADIDTQKAGAGMGIALTQRAGQVPDNQSNLGNMLTDANKLDSMGAGSSREAYLNSFFQKWSGSGLLGNATREQIAAAESFNKLGNIMASNQMSALGASDARQQLAIGANPHLDLSKLGNEQIIHMLQGNEDAIAAKSGAWEDWKLTHGTGSYAQFQNDLNKNFDLRVFQQQYMNKDELDALKKQLKSQGNYEEFIRKVLHARAQKWIQ